MGISVRGNINRGGAYTFTDGEGGIPPFAQDIDNYTAIRVDIGVINARGEVNLWWPERVVGWKVNR